MNLQDILSQPGPILVDTSFFNKPCRNKEVTARLRKAKRFSDIPEQDLRDEINFLGDFYNLLMQEKLCPPGVEQNYRFFTIPEVIPELGRHLEIIRRIEPSIFSNLSKMNKHSRVYIEEMNKHSGVLSLLSQYKKSISDIMKALSQRSILSGFDSDDKDAFEVYDSWIEMRTSEWRKADGNPEISPTDRKIIAAGLVSAYEGDTIIVSHDSGMGRVVKHISNYRERTKGKRMPLPSNTLTIYSNFRDGWHPRADCHRGYYPRPVNAEQQLVSL